MAEARVQPEACGDLNIRCQGLDGRTPGEHATQARASSDPAHPQEKTMSTNYVARDNFGMYADSSAGPGPAL